MILKGFHFLNVASKNISLLFSLKITVMNCLFTNMLIAYWQGIFVSTEHVISAVKTKQDRQTEYKAQDLDLNCIITNDIGAEFLQYS